MSALAIQGAKVMEEEHREEQAIALSVIFELLGQAGDAESLRSSLTQWKAQYECLRERIKYSEQQLSDADKSLASYVQSFDAYKGELRAILDTARDGRLAPKDMERLKEMVKT